MNDGLSRTFLLLRLRRRDWDRERQGQRKTETVKDRDRERQRQRKTRTVKDRDRERQRQWKTETEKDGTFLFNTRIPSQILVLALLQKGSAILVWENSSYKNAVYVSVCFKERASKREGERQKDREVETKKDRDRDRHSFIWKTVLYQTLAGCMVLI